MNYGMTSNTTGAAASASQLSDQDMASLILSALKRIASEYTTAALEVVDPQVRQLFESALHQTLRDQQRLFQTMKGLDLYGQVRMAPSQELQSELQHHDRTAQQMNQRIHQANAQRAPFTPARNNMPPVQSDSQMHPSGYGTNAGVYGHSSQAGYSPQYQTHPQNQQQQPMGMTASPVYRQAGIHTGQTTDARGPLRAQAAGASGEQSYQTVQHQASQQMGRYTYGANPNRNAPGYGIGNSNAPLIQLEEDLPYEGSSMKGQALSTSEMISTEADATHASDVSLSAQMYQTASPSTTEYNTSGTTQTKRHVTGSGEPEELPKH